MFANLEGKVALVTGGGQGIGRGIVEVLAAQGARVVIADISLDGPNQVAKVLRGQKREALVVKIDVTDRASVAAGVREASDKVGGVDILVNNAGVAGAPNTPPGDDQEANWQVTFSVNVMGSVHCCNEILPHMKAKKYGKIINVASMAGHAPRRSGGAYGVSKAAVLRYTKGLACEMAPFNVNVNAVCPGAVWTPFQQRGYERRRETDPSLAGRDPYQDFVERYAAVIPMKRPQEPEDIGKAVAFLASDDARYITGQCLHIDGGAIIRD
jgi:NAD(P)-dependent dehydrogenase (short-subunit alcohol dehydrogenase family)